MEDVVVEIPNALLFRCTHVVRSVYRRMDDLFVLFHGTRTNP